MVNEADILTYNDLEEYFFDDFMDSVLNEAASRGCGIINREDVEELMKEFLSRHTVAKLVDEHTERLTEDGSLAHSEFYNGWYIK